MAAKRKHVEKLGEVIGKSRPLLGSALILAGLIMAVSIWGYSAGQEVLFKHYFEPLLHSTESSGNNICGRFGATFALSSMLVVGAASYMLPVYFLWFGMGCFRRRAAVITRWEAVCSVAGVLLLSVLCALFQDFLGNGSAPRSATLPNGWGGKFGFAVFDNLAKPLLDVFGNALLFGSLYFISLVVVFVDSPAEAAGELAGVCKKAGCLLLRAAKAALLSLWSLPKRLFLAAFARRAEADEHESAPAPEISAAPAEVEEATFEPGPENAGDIDIRELAAFAAEMGSPSAARAENNPALVDVPEAAPEIRVDSEAEESVSDFTGVQIDFSKDAADILDSEPESPASAEPPAPEGSGARGDISVKDEDLEIVETPAEEAEPAPVLPPPPPKKKPSKKYVFPQLGLLSMPEKDESAPKEDYRARMEEIVHLIRNYGVKVLPDKVYPGPVITRYDVKLEPGVRISRITGLEREITMGIKGQSVRMIAPVPGLGTVGIEVPNIHRQNVSLREVLQSKQWRENNYEIPLALGEDATGTPIVANLKKMTHALIAGSTNSGKSVCINTIIISLLYKMTPDDLRLILVDPKRVEMQGYNSVPHMLIPVVDDVKRAAAALKWLTVEMDRRYTIFSKTGVRNIDGFNAKIMRDKAEMQRAEEEFADMSSEERQAALAANESAQAGDVEIPEEKLPYIVCIIDELADLMTVAGKDVEQYIARITQLARAAGIHMIIATQRPDVKVITGMIKNNLPTRIAFKVTSQIDSRTILDRKGAESLIGWGDMLFFNNGSQYPVRAQGAWVSDAEIEAVVEALKANGEPQYAEDVQAQIDADLEGGGDEIGEGEGGKFNDPITAKAVSIIKATGKASTSFLQRKLGIGYPRASRLMDDLEELGIVGPDNGSGKREIYLDKI